jgi:hypothetical protein
MMNGGKIDMPTKLTEEVINAAIDGFKAQKSRLNQQIEELRAMLEGGPSHAAASEPTPPKGRKMSVGARRRIAAAQRARWAKIRGESKPAAPAARKATKPKRRISPEGMKRIIAATKKRWRLQRAATKAKSVKVAKKKPPVRKAA